MLTLAISTSSKICSVALLEDDRPIKELNIDNLKTHSENLMPLIHEVLKKENKNVTEIDLIACDVGPGSFTGIRIGISTAKAIAEVNQIPVVSCTSLEALSFNVNSNTICSLIDARNNQVYCGIFNEKHEIIKNYMADDINTVIESLPKTEICFVGDGAVLHEKLLKGTFSQDNDIHASNIGICAYYKYKKGITETADSIAPMYLRKSQAERMRELK